MYSMKETCLATGMAYETLKFYCNEGLIPHVKRNEQKHRVFDERDIAWIKSLTCLKNCGMSLQEMKRYIQLCLEGPASIPQRKSILEEKRLSLMEKMAALQSSIEYIEGKQQFYDDVLYGRTPYISNILPLDSNQHKHTE